MIPHEILKKVRQIEIRTNLGIILCLALVLSDGFIGLSNQRATNETVIQKIFDELPVL